MKPTLKFVNNTDRRLFLGGTDAAVLIGDYPEAWKTVHDVWLEKVGRAEEIEINEPMEWGMRLEHPIAMKYSESHDVSAFNPEYMFDMGVLSGRAVVHDEYPFLAGSPDRLIVSPQTHHRFLYRQLRLIAGLNHLGLRGFTSVISPNSSEITELDRTMFTHGLEVKTAGLYNRKKWNEGGVPDHYDAQCQFYMMCCGIQRWDLVVLIGGNEYRQYEIEPNLPKQEKMKKVCVDFWNNHVLENRAP